MIGVMEPGTPCFDPSDEIMKSHRLVRSGGGTVLDTEGTTSFVLEYPIDFLLNWLLTRLEHAIIRSARMTARARSG